MKLSITLPLPPSTNNLYNTQHGHRVLSKQGQAYRAEAGWLIKSAATKLPWRTRPGQRYALELVLYWPDQRRRDLSNAIKCLEDTAADVLGFDDCRIDLLVVKRGPVDKDNPRTEVCIEVLP